MADKRTLLLAPTDVLLYAASSPDAVKAMFRQCFDRAMAAVCSTQAEYIDADGEIHARRWRLVFGEDLEDLTTKQRGFLHAAVFPQIAEQVRVQGERYVAKVWKEWYRALFLPDVYEMRKALVLDRATGQWRPAKRATPHRVRVSTEDLNIRQYSEHIDKVIAHATTEFGVVFQFDADEREAVRYRPKRRQRKAADEMEAADAVAA